MSLKGRVTKLERGLPAARDAEPLTIRNVLARLPLETVLALEELFERGFEANWTREEFLERAREAGIVERGD